MAAAARRVCVVMGVGPGIGAAVAQKFALEGYAVGLVSRREASIAPVKDTIEKAGGSAFSAPADCSDDKSIVSALAAIKEGLGPVEVLIYNTGPSGGGSWPPPGILEMDTADFRGGLEVGVVGAYAACKAVLPDMLATKKGTILFTGATAAKKGGAKFIKLSPAKFALRSMAQSLAREFQPQGVHVGHIIIDGMVKPTDFGGDSAKEAFYSSKPEEAWLDPEAIADTYFMLHAQPKSAWTHELEVRPSVETF